MPHGLLRVPSPLVSTGFLGDKWPAIDFYVELTGVSNRRLYFFIQVKATSRALQPRATHLKISSTKRDVARLLEIPGPTYLVGVHEPSKRVFLQSVHAGTPLKAITHMTHELDSANLARLHQEVRDFWNSTSHKPRSSVFA